MPDAERHYLQDELYRLIREDSAILDFLQSGSLDGMWYWDLENPEHEWISDSFWENLGYDPKQRKHLASEWQDLIFAEDLVLSLENFDRHSADPEHPYDQIVRYRHADGSTVWIRCRGIAIRNDTGEPIRMLGSHIDITATKQAEADLRQSNAKLAAVNLTLKAQADVLREAHTELEYFTSAAAHDLNEPLRKIHLFGDRLMHSAEARLLKEEQHYLQRIVDSAARLQQLLHSLVDYSSVGRHKPKFQSIDLQNIVSAVLSDIEISIKEYGASIEVGSLPTIEADPSQMYQLFTKLIQNALKFSRNDIAPKIEISASQARLGPFGLSWKITVADNGIGIPAQYREKVFEAFARLHSREIYQGSGVGLTIAKKIVERHDGSIRVEENKNGGCRFIVTLLQSVEDPDGEASVDEHKDDVVTN